MPYDEYDRREDGQPEYRSGYSYYNTGRKQKRHTGLIVVLVILAVLTGLASWAVNVLGVRVDLGQGSAVVTIGKSDTQPATTDAPDTTQAVVEPQTTTDPTETQTQTTPGLTSTIRPRAWRTSPPTRRAP